MTAPSSSAPEWTPCQSDDGECVPGFDRCLAHITAQERVSYLATLRPGSDVSHRGTTIATELLDELTGALRDEHGRITVGDAKFDEALFDEADFARAVFSGDITFTKARFSGHTSFGEARFEHGADFTDAVFEHHARFTKAQFAGDARFFSVHFNAEAEFDMALFDCDAWFFQAQFGRVAEFSRAQFDGEVWFHQALFRGTTSFDEARFGRRVNFGNAQFNRYCQFAGTQFDDDAGFYEARFLGPAGFSKAQLRGQAQFGGAQFAFGAQFHDVLFSGVAWFNGTGFDASVRFDGARFIADAQFNRAVFGGHAQFGEVIFSRVAWFDKAAFNGSAWFGKARFDGRTQFSGAKFEHFAVFTRIQFGGDVQFSEARFEGNVQFSGAQFDASAWFNGSHFAENANFDAVEFGGGASFDKAQFAGSAGFHQVKFSDGVTFSDTRFDGEALFGGVRFDSDASFTRTRFGGDAWFSGAQFDQDGWFTAAQFCGEARFAETKFARDAWFTRAQFNGGGRWGPIACQGTVSLRQARFALPATLEIASTRLDCTRTMWSDTAALRIRHADLDLTDAVLNAPVAVTTHHVPFFVTEPDGSPDEVSTAEAPPAVDMDDLPVRITSVRGVDAGHLALANVALDECAFTGAFHLDQLRLEGQVSFAQPPSGWRRRRVLPTRWSRRRTLAEEQHWRHRASDAGWTPSPTPLNRTILGFTARPTPTADPQPNELAGTYRALRKALEDRGDAPGAADFYYGEMEMRRHDRTAPRAERGLLTAYWLLSGYGLRASRALAALLLVIAATVLAIMLVGLPATTSQPITTGIAQPGGRIVLHSSNPPPTLPPWGSRLTGDRAATTIPVVLDAVVFRAADTNLMSAGIYVDMFARLVEPSLLALAVLAIRGRVRR